MVSLLQLIAFEMRIETLMGGYRISSFHEGLFQDVSHLQVERTCFYLSGLLTFLGFFLLFNSIMVWRICTNGKSLGEHVSNSLENKR